jgi:hypothetical protein
MDKLFAWQKFEEFQNNWSALNGRTSDQNLFAPRGQAPQDGYSACIVGSYLNAEYARLCQSDPPDFELKVNENVLGFENVEGFESNRRRGDEYRNGQLPDSGSAKDWHYRATSAPSWFKSALELKVKKYQTPQNFSLAIYISSRSFGVTAEKTIPDACKQFAEALLQCQQIRSDISPQRLHVGAYVGNISLRCHVAAYITNFTTQFAQ